MVLHEDFLNGDHQGVAALRSLQSDGTGDGVGLRGSAVEARTQGRDRLVLRAFEISRAGVISLDLERFTGLHGEQRFVPPIEGVFLSQVPGDLLHGGC